MVRGRRPARLLPDARRAQGRHPGGDQARLPQAGSRAAPGREPRPGRAGPVQGGHHGLRGALRPGEATHRRPRRRPALAVRAPTARRQSVQRLRRLRRRVRGVLRWRAVRWAAAAVAAAGSGRAPTRCCRCRSRWRRPPSACAARSVVDTAIVCETCRGNGCAPGTSPRTCVTCGGAGEIQSVQRSFLGQVMTTRACSACGGTGEQIPSPCPTCGAEGRVRARRTKHVDIPAGIEDGMRIRLVRPGRGRARRRAGRRSLHRDRRAAARHVQPRGL